MRRMKYIIIDDELQELPFVFPDFVNHNEFAHAMQRLIRGEVVAAGFANIDGGKFITYGTSESLRISSRPEDDDVVNKAFGTVSSF